MTWQPEVGVTYPDAELLLTTSYRALIAAAGETGVKVDRKIPNPRPTRLVAITRDGGTSGNLRDRPRMRFRVWDETDQKATDLARLVVSLAAKAVNGTVLRSEVLSGPFEVADESGGHQRYALIEFHTRGVQSA